MTRLFTPEREAEVARPGVHSLECFTMAVPDLKAAEEFYSAFGLLIANRETGFALQTHASAHDWAHIVDGSRKSLRQLTFTAFEADKVELRRRIEQAGVRLIDPPEAGGHDGLWFHDPDGLLIEVRVGPKTTSAVSPASTIRHAQQPARGAPYRRTLETTKPSRLSHVLMFTRSVPASLDFYERTIGLRLSDRVGDELAFMHCIHGSDHHVLALLHSEARGLHHTSWTVPNVEAVGLGAMQMKELGFAQGWGTGRHVLGSNYFHYVRDPWGSYAEYSAGMDFVPAGHRWDSADHNPEDAFYLWGPEPPADFGVNYEMSLPTGA